jgi:hypothetical protein
VPVVVFKCVGCGATLRADVTKAGRKGKCTKCGGLVTVPAVPRPKPPAAHVAETAAPSDPQAAPTETYEPARLKPPRPRRPAAGAPTPKKSSEPPPDEEPEAEEPEPAPRPVDKARAWRKVSLGLFLLTVSTSIGLVGAGVVMVGCLFGRVQAVDDTGRVPVTTSHLLTAMLVGGVLTQLVTMAAYGLCAFTPGRYSSKNMPLVALALTLVVMATSIVIHVVARTDSSEIREAVKDFVSDTGQQKLKEILEKEEKRWTVVRLLGLLERLLNCGASLAFLFFLQELARRLKDYEAADICGSLMKLTVGFVLVSLVAGPIGGFLFSFSGFGGFLSRIFMMLAWVLGFVALGQQVWFLKVASSHESVGEIGFR